MSDVTIFHNPRCSKSRQTLALLEEHGISPRIVRYLEEPPTVTELNSLLRALALRPRDLLRKGEALYKQLGLTDGDLSDDDLLEAMAAHPILIERPIVRRGELAVLGRPPENVLELL
ncbi:MAG: arsenate reductase (glutaredoxin) [Pseudomonadota bacterium]